MKKVGVFGGTFDPIHYGHLRSALEVSEEKGLESVIFVPNNIPPHKDFRGTSSDVRLEMVRLAVSGVDEFSVSDCEIKRGGKSYTIDTVRELKSSMNGVDLYFIVGSDAFSTISTWKDYRDLLCEVNFLVMCRPSHTYSFLEEVLPGDVFSRFSVEERGRKYINKVSGTVVEYVNVTPLEISSTYIRNLIKGGRSIKFLVPKEVEEFIKEKKLYL